MIKGGLANKGATMWYRGMMYKAMEQSWLLYVSEIWVVTGGDAKGLGGVPSLGGQKDHGDDRETWGRQGVGITPCGGVNEKRRIPPHLRVHQEMAGKHSGKDGLQPNL